MIRAILSAALLSSLFVIGRYVDAQDSPSGVNTTQVREDLKLVLGEYATAHADYIKALREAKTTQDQDKVEEIKPQPIPGAARYLEWAEHNPKDPLAVDALVAIVKHGRFTSEAQRAAKMLASQHLNMASDKFNEAAFYVILWPMPVVDEWFRTYLEESNNQETQAHACFQWAMHKKWLSKWALLEQTPDSGWVKDLKRSFGAESMNYLSQLDQEQMAREAVALFELVLMKFADVKLRGQPLADHARPHYFELNKLAIGKPAPEIEGEDVDGVPFRLSEYRGKVVMLSFWATWCAPCMAMVPQERALVKRLENRAFALLGVNGDQDRDPAKKAIEEKGITWRSWWDLGTSSEPISKTWNVRGWPTIYLLDHRGIIRYKTMGSEGQEELEHAIDALLEDLEDRIREPSNPG